MSKSNNAVLKNALDLFLKNLYSGEQTASGNWKRRTYRANRSLPAIENSMRKLAFKRDQIEAELTILESIKDLEFSERDQVSFNGKNIQSIRAMWILGAIYRDTKADAMRDACSAVFGG
jgi:hypothetical protein